MPQMHTHASRRDPTHDLIAASLLTSDEGAAEVHMVTRDGRLIRLPTDETTARRLIVSLWQALDQRN